jgi:hypothetical protein
MIGKVELNGKVGEIVRLERDRYILKVWGMGEVNIGAEYLVVPMQKRVSVVAAPTPMQVNSISEEPSPKRNKVHEKLRDMGFDPDKIDKYVTAASLVIRLWRTHSRMTQNTHTRTEGAIRSFARLRWLFIRPF